MTDVTIRETDIPRHGPLSATAANQLREEHYDLAELGALARETAGALPPEAVFWLLAEYGARQREVAALISECQDRADENERLKQQLEALRLRLRETARQSGGSEPEDDERARVEAAARSVC
ncbi:MAG TPA: hypothetical protein VND64_26405 [Pirellulales bacterium]|nr:hypothetical protein [Pirellulales bacterium]